MCLWWRGTVAFFLRGWGSALKGPVVLSKSSIVFQRELREGYWFSLVMMLLENRCTFSSCVYLGSDVKCFQRVCTRFCMCQCGLMESVFRSAIAQAQGGSFAASAKAQQKEGFPYVEFVLGSDSALVLFSFVRQRCSKKKRGFEIALINAQILYE